MMNENFCKPGIWHSKFDADGNCISAEYDASFRELLGYSTEEYTDTQDAWVTRIHPEDHDRVLRHLADCAGKHPEGKDFDIEYRMMTAHGYRWFHDFGTFTRREDGSAPECRGVVFDIQDTVDRFSHAALAENSRRLLALTDNLVSLYEVDLESGACDAYVTGDFTRSSSVRTFASREDFFDSLRSYMDEMVFPPDRDGLYRTLNSSVIRQELEGREHFDYFYRVLSDHGPVWIRLRIVYKDDRKNTVIVGIFDAGSDVEAKQIAEQKQQLEKTLTFTNYFLNTFVSAYYINLDTLECQPYKRTAELDENFPVRNNYLQSISEYIRANVHPDDREPLLSVVQPERLKALLKLSPEYHRIFRDIGSGRTRQYRMQVIRGTEEGSAALGFLDMTDELQEQQKRLLGAVPLSSDIFTKSNVGLWSMEQDEGQPPRLYLDDAMQRLIGFEGHLSPEDAYREWRSRVDYSSVKMVEDAIGRMVAGEHAEAQYPWHHPDGHMHIARCGGVRNPEYKAGIRIEGIHQDVTEMLRFDEAESKRRTAREQELTLAEFRSSALVYLNENEGDVSSYLDYFAARLRELFHCDQVVYRNSGGDMYVNNAPELGEQFRIPHETCAACPYYDMHSPLYSDGVAEMENRQGIRGVPAHPDCPVKSSLARLVYLDGRVDGCLTIHYIRDHHEFTDYERQTLDEFSNLLSLSLSRHMAETKRAELEHNLANQQRQLQSFGSMVNAALWSMEINDRNEVVRITLSDEFRHMLGFESAEDFPDTLDAWVSVLHPEDRERTLAYSRRSIESRTFDRFVYDLEYRCIRKNGEVSWYHAVGRMEDGGNGLRVLHGIFFDISADKQLEEQRKRLSEALAMAKSANRAKSAFLFNMSHDIRTPLNAITGFINIAKRNIGNPEMVLDCLTKTQQAGNLLLSLINGILEMSRIEAGKAELEEKPGDVRYSFSNISTTLQELAKEKHIDLQFRFGEITDCFVFVDHDRSNRIFTNIISNAIKYTHSGGWVRVFCRQTGRQGNTGYYRYTISDNGIGMSEEFQKHLFDEFSREHNTTVSGIQGSGLGMAVVRSLVELMQGSIECESTQGKGTTFTVTLPLRIQTDPDSQQYLDPDTGRRMSAHLEPGANAPDISASLAGKRMLVVEDNEMNREITVYILSEQDCIAEEATDGTEAVELLREKGPDYYDGILMDIQMPLMNGYDAAKAIRTMYPDARLPIIALSANAFAEDKARSLAAGMNDHIAKPIRSDELFRILAKYL